ncbi:MULTISPECIES: DUF456 domain-containing protein [unclassified Streptomyces]|uniref:DUF456 domain-containing protein n=1 Tax=unclassified Streptomyces TaxID=2593676 RepID=UPI002DDB3A5B|nr:MULTISPECIES: DUF456 domain-containing protein [unclassified Streptomyces]WSA91626.1 DUF456 domain-containing protein [Streptomyces sp. NBC_01795]WSB75997.1 DUF456 domain-containing protein [Streptomyces sp. NBC_01775]WSS15728.1 DUF456 domain-containing protein [Streptomyces sp. NBC_01186]WSS44567.1 DUF456 domain-containing protein [Streptomyces sp. NBC_01187]
MDTSGTLSVPQPLLVGIVLLLGLIGSVLPGVPGTLVVWASVFWWAVWDHNRAAWWLLVAATGLLLLTAAVRMFAPAQPRRRSEAGRRLLLMAGASGTVGFVLVPVLGVLPGFLAGIYGKERMRLGSHGAAVASTRTVMRGGGWRTLADLTASLLVAVGWVIIVLWGPRGQG